MKDLNKDLQEELNELLVDAACSGDINTIKYVLTAPMLAMYAEIHYMDDYALTVACRNNQREIVEYLLTAPELLIPNKFGYIIGHATLCSGVHLLTACRHESYDVIDYLFPPLHAEIHAGYDYIFRSLVAEKAYDVLKHLIFVHDLPKTLDMMAWGDEETNKMFALREFKQKIDEELPTQIISKKMKL